MAEHPQALRSKRGAAGHGRVLPWRGGSLWIGREAGAVQRHAHHAIQLTLAPAAGVRVRGADEPTWTTASACIIAPDAMDEFDGCGGDVVMLFVEPESTSGRRLLARHARGALSLIEDAHALALAAQVLAAQKAGADDATLVAAGQAIVEALAGGVAVDAVDPRIARSVAWVCDHLHGPVSLAQAAAVAHLSPGRFRHLFVAQTGIAFRAYVLWARLNVAMAAGMAGNSWTNAAQAAGFADSAHLSRTCQRMFGITPGMLGRDLPSPH